MNEYYENVYKKRLNRYGLNFQARLQGQRERDFENYLLKSIYRIDFIFDNERHPGSLEHYQQDNTETVCYLLTRRDLIIPNGTILEITNQLGNNDVWMIWWLEQITSSGYNRYVVLKMTHYLKWKNGDQIVEQWAYFSGTGTAAISDAVRTATGKPLYTENDNLHTFITTQNETICRDLYFEVTQGNITQAYVVTEFDINSTPGVNYVTVDHVPVRPAETGPIKVEEENKEDYFWLQGGNK